MSKENEYHDLWQGVFPEDYAVRQVNDKHWEVYKFDAHHKKLDQTYHVEISRVGNISCTCPASQKCKHIAMAMQYRLYSSKKRDLF